MELLVVALAGLALAGMTALGRHRSPYDFETDADSEVSPQEEQRGQASINASET